MEQFTICNCNLENYNFLLQDDTSSCSDDSGNDVFKSVARNTTAFCVWKIEVSFYLSLISKATFNFLVPIPS